MHKRLVTDTNRFILSILISISKCVLQIRCRLLPHIKVWFWLNWNQMERGSLSDIQYPSLPAVTHWAHSHKSPGNILQAPRLIHFRFLLDFFHIEMISTQKMLKRLSRTSVQLRQYSSSKGNNNTDNKLESPTQKNKNENSEVCTRLNFLCSQKYVN